jgi:hypothetical protein
MYTFEQLKDDVRKEAEALKIHATKEERGRLDIKTFNPGNYDACIYGQLTESCFSRRAAYLIHNCCTRYFKSHKDRPDESMEECAASGRVLELVNGESIEGVTSAEELDAHRAVLFDTFHFSAIEAYIMTPEANNANLISFLRGETETLEL